MPKGRTLDGKEVSIEGMITHVEWIDHPQGGKKVIEFMVPAYVELIFPAGFLVADIACIALFHYAISARSSYEDFEKNVIALEGDADPVEGGPNYQQLFKSVARSYGIVPEKMVKFWSHVDAQFEANGMPELPHEERYRFSNVTKIILTDA